MVNGLGVLGWGVGGIEAEAAMLGQPISMLIPEVVGFKLTGKLRAGATATDLVLTVDTNAAQKGVVGPVRRVLRTRGGNVPVVDRATIGNMSPEYGSTCAIFPIDALTLDYLRLTGRSEERIALVEAYMKEQGLFHDSACAGARFSATRSSWTSAMSSPASRVLDARRTGCRSRRQGGVRGLSAVATAARPSRRERAPTARTSPDERLEVWGESTAEESPIHGAIHPVVGEAEALEHGSIVIAAITSCTNTSNPSLMLAAGLLAKKAVERGLGRQPWVKTTLAPGSRVVTAYYDRAGLTPYLEELGFNLVGYGCTTCIGNSGPLPAEISEQIHRRKLVVAAALSGNRNFEGRIHSEVRANYLMSPPLVVAFALAGRITIDLETEPLGHDQEGRPSFSARPLAEPGGDPSDRAGGDRLANCIRTTIAISSLAMSGGASFRLPRATSIGGIGHPPTSKARHFSRTCRERGSHGRSGHPGRSSHRRIGRQHHHGPYLSGGQHPGEIPCGTVTDISEGVAPKDFNSYGATSRQSRGDGPRHLRERSHPESARSRNRRRLHDVSADQRSELDLSMRPSDIQGKAFRSLSWQARTTAPAPAGTGRPKGPYPPRGPGRHRRELRTDSPVEPRRHGHLAAAVRGGRLAGEPRPHGAGDLRYQRDCRWCGERVLTVAQTGRPRPPR